MLDRATLDLARADAAARAGDRVVRAPHDPDESVPALAGQVAGERKGAGDCVAGGGGVAPVSQDHPTLTGSPHRRGIHLAARQLAPGPVHDAHVVTAVLGVRRAERPGGPGAGGRAAQDDWTAAARLS